MGALCDKVGLRWLVILPVSGYLIGAVFGLFNAIYIDEIPLEMFILNEFGGFLGGFSIYYLGVYGIGSAMAKPAQRASVLTRLDGVERVAITLGIFASPRIADSLGYVACFAFKLGFITLALIYALIFVKNPLPPRETEKTGGETGGKTRLARKIGDGIKKHVFENVEETMRTIFKSRKYFMRAMILLHLGLYALIILQITQQGLTFLYMRKYEVNFNRFLLLFTCSGVSIFTGCLTRRARNTPIWASLAIYSQCSACSLSCRSFPENLDFTRPFWHASSQHCKPDVLLHCIYNSTCTGCGQKLTMNTSRTHILAKIFCNIFSLLR